MFIGFSIFMSVALTPIFNAVFKCLAGAVTENREECDRSHMEENVPDDVLCVFCVASPSLTYVSHSTEENFIG